VRCSTMTSSHYCALRQLHRIMRSRSHSSTTTSTTTRRLSVDFHSSNGVPPRRASFQPAPSSRRASTGVEYTTPRRASTGVEYKPHNVMMDWNIPTMTFPREVTWLAGAPGAGKGTNSTHIAKARGYQSPTIVMSSLLESPECKRIKDAGGMVDDETVQRELLKELAKPQYRNGVVVDGFPRTEKQAQWLRSLHEQLATPLSPINFNFVMLFIDEEASVARQLSRGEVIRKLNLVRSASGLAPLEERATDVSDAAARVRYSNFIQQYETINKLHEHFPLSIVDASASIEVVRERINSTLTLKTTTTTTTTSQFSSSAQRYETAQPAYMYM